GDGSVWDAVIYDGMTDWRLLPIVPAEGASRSGGITAVTRVPGKIVLSWIGGDGSIWQANWNEVDTKWRPYAIIPAMMASTSGDIISVPLNATTIETYWIGGDGSVWYTTDEEGSHDFNIPSR